MLSIDNAYTLDELREWDARVKRGLGREEVEYEAELKIDGVSIDLLYETGALRQKDPKLAAARRLSAYVYHLVAADGARIASQSAAYALLEKLGFPLNPERALCAS